MLVRKQNDVILVADIAGHKSLNTTRRYTLPTVADKAKALEELNMFAASNLIQREVIKVPGIDGARVITRGNSDSKSLRRKPEQSESMKLKSSLAKQHRINRVISSPI
jgi:hypothetical protein